MIENIDQLLLLSEPHRVACCIHQLEAQVNNGGFHQYFSNTGKFVPHALSALSAVGAEKTGRLLSEAVRIAYPYGFPSDPELFQEKLADYDGVAEALWPLSQAFWQYEEPLADLVNSFLSANAGS